MCIRDRPELEGLPIVAITAHAMHEDKKRALSAGIARYLSKPLSRAALFGTLRALLPNKILPRKPEQATHRSESAALSAPIVLNNTALPPCLDAGAIERLNVSPETYQKILRGYVRNTSEAVSSTHLMAACGAVSGSSPTPDAPNGPSLREFSR